MDLDTLRAKIEERLRLAKAAKSHTGRWRWDHSFGDMCNDRECPYGMLLDEADGDAMFLGTVLMQVHGYDIHQPWQGAAHIAANDPAFVIRDCERDLKVLERHKVLWREIGWRVDDDTEYAELPVCERCVPKHSHFRTHADVPVWPCDEIRDLAEVYEVSE